MLLPHLLAALVFLMPTTADTQAIAVIPRPVKLTRDSGGGTFALGTGTVINGTGETRELGNVLAEYLAPATGLRIPVRTGAPAGGGASSGQIVLRIDTTLKRLGTEGYTFEATK